MPFGQNSLRKKMIKKIKKNKVASTRTRKAIPLQKKK